MSARILVGTASWTDPGFVEDWYPHGLPKNQLLGWYAEHFNFVEINSTFYSIPAARVAEGWVRQTPKDFVFDVKVFKLLSRHAVDPKFLPPELRKDAKVEKNKVLLTPELESLVAERFLAEIEPLRSARKLGALLLQLSPSFRPKTHTLSELETLVGIFGEHRFAVELRNRDWMVGDEKEKTVEFFTDRKVTLVTVDAPESEHFTVMPFSDVVTNPRLVYWRFHGRNEDAFVKGRTVAERFNYDYSEEELSQIADKIEEMAGSVDDIHAVFNNNRSRFAPKAAGKILELLQKRGLKALGPAPRPQRELF
jgi:uncharacterized protein YecE (DUF72 family)